MIIDPRHFKLEDQEHLLSIGLMYTKQKFEGREFYVLDLIHGTKAPTIVQELLDGIKNKEQIPMAELRGYVLYRAAEHITDEAVKLRLQAFAALIRLGINPEIDLDAAGISPTVQVFYMMEAHHIRDLFGKLYEAQRCGDESKLRLQRAELERILHAHE